MLAREAFLLLEPLHQPHCLDFDVFIFLMSKIPPKPHQLCKLWSLPEYVLPDNLNSHNSVGTSLDVFVVSLIYSWFELEHSLCDLYFCVSMWELHVLGDRNGGFLLLGPTHKAEVIRSICHL
jgi:hypothetical protein